MDLVDISNYIENIKAFGKSDEQKQKDLNVSDAWHFWDILVMKYDVKETIGVLNNFASDKDLVVITNAVLRHVNKGISSIESIMNEYTIPLPPRPPETGKIQSNLEVITDRYIFIHVFEQLKDVLTSLATAFKNSSSPRARIVFKTHLISQMELLDNLSVFGDIKNLIDPLPNYQPYS